MKKFIAFLKELWASNGDEILEFFATLITMGWFAYLVCIVKNSEGGIVGKIFFFVWSLVLAFIWIVHKSTKNN